jgi:hypothetical protein
LARGRQRPTEFWVSLQKSLHIKLPLQTALRSEKSREIYVTVITELISDAARELTKPSRFSPLPLSTRMISLGEN